MPSGLPERLEEALEIGSADVAGSVPTLAERRDVTVLFCDLSGFTSLCERHDPEQVVSVINRFFGLVTEVAQRWGGVVDKFLGDAALVVFGAPRSVEGAPSRAVSAAVEIQDRIRRLSAEIAARPPGIELHTSCAVARGLVVSGVLGSGGRFDYTVIGDAVNVAARLQKACAPDEILIDRSVAEAIEPKAIWIALEQLAPLPVKGKREPLRAFRVKPLAERSLPQRAGEEPGLVGRRRELDALEFAIHRVESGAGGALLLVGESGVGKSRLLAAASRRARSHELPVIELRAKGEAPGAMLHELFRSVGDALAGALLEAGDTLALPGMAAEALATRAGRRGFLVVVDDLLALDAASRTTLAAALPNLGRLGGFLLAAARLPAPLLPDALERSDELRPFERVEVLDVGPLPAFDAKRLLVQLRPADAQDHPLLERLVREARGIPGELMRLAGASGIEAELARADALAPPAPLVLKALSLLGGCEVRLLAEIVGLSDDEVREVLTAAQAAGLLRSDGERVELAQEKVREALAARLVGGERRRLHGQIARALEARGEPEAAVHWAQSDEASAAAAALLDLATRQLELGQPEAALSKAREGIERAREAAAGGLGVRLGLVEGRALLALGRRTEAISALYSAWNGSGSEEDRLTAVIELGRLLSKSGRDALTQDLLGQASRQMAALPELLARLERERGTLAFERNDYREARRRWSEALKLAEGCGAHALKSRCAMNLAILDRAEQEAGDGPRATDDPAEVQFALRQALRMVRAGQREEALTALEGVVSLALASAELGPALTARQARARLLLEAGHPTEAREEAEAALELARRLSDPAAMGHCCKLLGLALCKQGKLAAAEHYLRQAVRTFLEAGDKVEAAESLVAVGEASTPALGQAYLKEARQLFAEAGAEERAAEIAARLSLAVDAPPSRH